ncbi:exodeoxyribonuclease V subunit gamma [Pseudomonas peli]|uniref:exodeoxyribonuclease V subunit gamma n=1 Tax=Pseudomonas peli TaxID=592361 RepID=UPI0024ACF1AD|nr:exodeoxyribonuclease V subunit gamma [Pseudomonas peli]
MQSNGIAQWLKLALAEDPEDDDMGGCGIAAAIDVQLPGSFMWQLYRRCWAATKSRKFPARQGPTDLAPDAPAAGPDRASRISSRCSASSPTTPTCASATSSPSAWPTCSTSTRSTAPTG